MRLYWIRTGRASMRVILQEAERDAQGHKEGGDVQVEPGVTSLQARKHQGPHRPRRLGEGHRTLSPQKLQKKPALWTPCFQIFSLLSERLHFCCFNLPSLWDFVTTVLGNKYNFL